MVEIKVHFENNCPTILYTKNPDYIFIKNDNKFGSFDAIMSTDNNDPRNWSAERKAEHEAWLERCKQADIAAAKPELTFNEWLSAVKKCSREDYDRFRLETQYQVADEYDRTVTKPRQPRVAQPWEPAPAPTALPESLKDAPAERQLAWINLCTLMAEGKATAADFAAAGLPTP